MAIRLTLLVATLLIYPEVVLAERAWVLWVRDTYVEIDKSGWGKLLRGMGFSHRKEQNVITSWEVRAAYPQYAQCQRALEQDWKEQEQSFGNLDKAKLSIQKIERKIDKSLSAHFKDGESWTLSFFCLPDTVDPRISK